MLVLSRMKNESLIIDNDITITVVELRHDKVRLGVDAPGWVPVHRSEVQEKVIRTADNNIRQLDSEIKRHTAAKKELEHQIKSEKLELVPAINTRS